MYEDKLSNSASARIVPVQSKAMEIIERINRKITSLSEVCTPIVVSRPTVVGSEKEIQSGLINELNIVEERITSLLDSIQV